MAVWNEKSELVSNKTFLSSTIHSFEKDLIKSIKNSTAERNNKCLIWVTPVHFNNELLPRAKHNFYLLQLQLHGMKMSTAVESTLSTTGRNRYWTFEKNRCLSDIISFRAWCTTLSVCSLFVPKIIIRASPTSLTFFDVDVIIITHSSQKNNLLTHSFITHVCQFNSKQPNTTQVPTPPTPPYGPAMSMPPLDYFHSGKRSKSGGMGGKSGGGREGHVYG